MYTVWVGPGRVMLPASRQTRDAKPMLAQSRPASQTVA